MADEKKPYIGGQAVIEGVMMRAPTCISVAVRRPDKSIVVREGLVTSKIANSKLWKLPGFRGVAMLVESLKIGFSALNFSAEQQMTEEERESVGDGKLMIAFSMVFALGLFVALPQALAMGSGKLFGFDFGLSEANFHIAIGGFKMLIFLTYLLAISQLNDVRRTFQYHGAEHKTINAHEAMVPLTVENVRAQTTMHPRCGTTFLVVVIAISILAGALFAPLLLPNAEGVLGQAQLLALRIGLLPFIAAVSYEFQRFSARYCTTGPLRVVLLPGFLFQKISTREPDDDQIEIAIAAFRAAQWREEVGDSVPAAEEEPHVFPSFETLMERFASPAAEFPLAAAE